MLRYAVERPAHMASYSGKRLGRDRGSGSVGQGSGGSGSGSESGSDSGS